MAALAAIATEEVCLLEAFERDVEAVSATGAHIPETAEARRARVLRLPQARVRLEARTQAAEFSLSTFAGRLIELSSQGASAALGGAALLLHEAQQQGEPVAWVQAGESLFYPPDLVVVGIDLAALPIVRPPTPGDVGKTLTHLLRSGAFGLVVVDLHGLEGASVEGRGRADAGDVLPVPLQSRLERMAQVHGACVLCLTCKAPEAASLGPLVSWRGEARRSQQSGRLRIEIATLKDKRGAPGWQRALDFERVAGLT